MSSSGLIYAVIVGAWAAYLVPMWLRRQDELNEARPTERFSTAIRLLSGRAAMERRISRHLDDDTPGSDARTQRTPAPGPVPPSAPASATPRPATRPTPPPGGADSQRRAALLARRRRMVILLFAAFTVGMVIAAVGGVRLLWAPAVPAVLFSLYISHMRRQERRRYEVKLDRRRAAEAAQRVRDRERDRRRAAAVADTAAVPAPQPAAPAGPAGRPVAGSGSHRTQQVLAEAADPDADDWGDSPADRSTGPESWDPVPVPLPTYVTAPVAPRSTGSLDLNAPDTWSAGRSVVPPPSGAKRPPATPLFDQYADDTPHPRAANE
ncbi:hypothetical protein [Streptacidiphilus sp. EB129]|uniref:divisome protein SepX/GlpR n=1 Tax=Streptacidiphilus sp. EB129 TaxID=3156262 RepID=UPI003516CFE5